MHDQGAGDADPQGHQMINKLAAAGIWPDPFDLRVLLARLEQHRGRRIRVETTPAHTGSSGVPCGMRISTMTADHIFLPPAASPLHQHHIALHEIGHVLLGHRGRTAESDQILSRLVPHLDPRLVSRVLGSSIPADQRVRQDREAESFATQALADTLFGPAAWPGRAHRDHALRELRPLWHELTQAIPGMVLHAPVGDPRCRTAQQLHRYVVEIYDALLILTPQRVTCGAGLTVRHRRTATGPRAASPAGWLATDLSASVRQEIRSLMLLARQRRHRTGRPAFGGLAPGAPPTTQPHPP